MGHGGIFGRSSLGSTEADVDSACSNAKIDAALDFSYNKSPNPDEQNFWKDDPGASDAYHRCYTLTYVYMQQNKGAKPADTVVTPTTTTTTADFSGQACNSKPIIEMVQGAIHTTADGNWGPASQTALQKAGGTFQSYAPGCTGNPPSYGAITGGGGGGTVTTTYTAPPAPAVASSGLLSKPIVWVGLAMAAVGGYVLLTGKKKGGKVKRNARKSTAKRAKTKIVKISWGGTRKKPRNRVNDILMQVEHGAYLIEGGSPFGKGNLRDAVARARREHIGETRIATAIARGKAGAKRWLKR